MLGHIVQAYGGQPAGLHVVFANTGKEHPRTLDFVQRCASEWGVKIDWLEYDWSQPHRYKTVTHNSASRAGEPFSALIERKGFVPNPHVRFCTGFLKQDPIRRHAYYTLGLKTHTAVIGFRADEGGRVMRMVANCTDRRNKLGEMVALPMVDAGVRENDVKAWWKSQPFDLEIPSEAGNCDLCFLKGRRKVMRLISEEPSVADWWIEQERKVTEIPVPGRDAARAYMRFRSDPMETMDALKREAMSQGDLFFGRPDTDGDDCLCTD